MPIKLKRIYDEAEKSDGMRILIDRLWPRGITKEKAVLDEWLKTLAPSTELRKWFHAAKENERWDEFVKKYKKELGSEEVQEDLARLRGLAKKKTITLLTATKDASESYLKVLEKYVH